MKKIKLGGIIEHTGLSLISIENIPAHHPGMTGLTFQSLSRRGINVEFIIQGQNRNGESQILFGVSRTKSEEAMVILNQIKSQIGDPEFRVNSEIAVVSVFGPHFREVPGIAGTFFTALNSKSIDILAISTSISTISCVIPSSKLSDAIKAIGEAFDIPGEED
jgi:aspartokinase